MAGYKTGEKEKIVLEFVKFCELLRLPENQIKVRTGQFTETQINTRQESDMLGEAVRQLVNLNKYTAFAKVLTAEGVWTGQIKTMALKTEIHEDHKPLYATLVHLHTLPYVKERIDIHAEIIEREEGWRVAESDEPPPITS